MPNIQEFLTANLHRKSPATVPVSHPERGFDIINRKQLSLWTSEKWGWQEESWDVLEEPKGAKRKSAGKKATEKKSE